MVLLLSNDDGVFSTGITVLRKFLSEIAEVWVVAPDREKSAASHSLTLHRPLKVKQIEEKVFAVDGTPTDAVILGINKILPKKPDLVVSGINEGPNLGDDITYSGTVAAAMEGTILGYSSVAFSLAISTFKNFAAAAKVAQKIVQWVHENKLPEGTLLNVNIPDVKEYERLKGVKWTRQGKRVYTDYIYELRDPRGNIYYWIGGFPVDEDPQLGNGDDTDIVAVKQGYVSITPVKLEMTHFEFLEKIRETKIEL
ncbi:5'-nucleotidase [Thermosulfidibacter takaii ABI70S6]|uniref:5'-nucleotidase SurE n=1 Tax=Thermosulfidibacter takaii (strain DSM 17441 / JCM 13301 / NBRC 103674 / ABI70S6) TaxID=1298851 RepID=A0A0S3QSL4_THET7|nr:5'/3'-nucleotidase SurE [Thermosulfidibacter takaii]BAT71292.1 5'-nucleotidase [Thermosulfidibacter takaii ABI70S6]